MARRWVRGPTPNRQAGAGNYYHLATEPLILMYYIFRYVMGYQFIEENLASGSFENCTEDTGSDGVLTNSDFTFSATSASFSIGVDEGKFIVIVDSTNEVNCGVYEILTVNSATQVVINFYSTDYPTAATGLTWYLVDPTNLLGGTNIVEDDNAVFQVNNATAPWQIKISMFSNADAWDRIKYEVAPEAGSWDTGTHAWKTTAPLIARPAAPSIGYYTSGTCPRMYVYGDTDGESLFIMMHLADGTSSKTFASVFVLDPIFETTPAHPARDKVGVFGGDASNSAEQYRSGHGNEGIGYGYSWIEAPFYRSRLARWCGWWDSASEYFKRTFTSPNHRNGAEYDALPIWIAADADVSENPQWNMIGGIPTDHCWLTACAGIGELTTFGTKQFMHWRQGITTPWPGLQHS